VSIGGAECGTINTATKNGQWYTVKCARPLRGDKVTLETTQNDYLSISGIEVYTATVVSGGMGSFRKTTTKKINYTKYNNYCVSAAGKDLP
jgi:hypothetical protein